MKRATEQRIERRWVDPKTLVVGKNKKNWKKHPERQKRAVWALIQRNGWARPLLWNTRTKRLIDGHCRLEVAIEKKVPLVPVDFGDWSEAQEKELLASLDTTGNMSIIDNKNLSSLVRDIGKGLEDIVKTDQDALEVLKMSIDIDAIIGTDITKKPIIERKIGKKSISGRKVKMPRSKTTNRSKPHKVSLGQRIDAALELYPSSNEWGIPDIPLKACYKEILMPDRTYDGEPQNHHAMAWYSWAFAPFKHKEDGGFLNFFTDDYRFNGLYHNPTKYIEKFLAWNFFAIVEPDFSTMESWPLVGRMMNVYKSRWVCNFLFKNTGIPIIPQIRFCEFPEKSMWMYDTLPNAPVMCINAGMRTANRDIKEKWEETIACCIQAALSRRKIKYILINAGSEQEASLSGFLPKGPTYVYLENWTTARRRIIRK